MWLAVGTINAWSLVIHCLWGNFFSWQVWIFMHSIWAHCITDTPLILPCPEWGGWVNFHKAKGEDNINCISKKNKPEGVLKSRLDLRNKYCRRILYSRERWNVGKGSECWKDSGFHPGAWGWSGAKRDWKSQLWLKSLGAGTEGKRLIWEFGMGFGMAGQEPRKDRKILWELEGWWCAVQGNRNWRNTGWVSEQEEGLIGRSSNINSVNSGFPWLSSS